ncbi:hypothetical protein H0H92_003206 [Tricholoma furcatifolium]|nr:hypothetical protein H0H92_003206 [Tricholoma furcatifolium]
MQVKSLGKPSPGLFFLVADMGLADSEAGSEVEIIPSPAPAQVGGGPYNLRHVIKTTPNASPEARKAARRRLELEVDVPADEPSPFLTGPLAVATPGTPFEEAEFFATGPVDELEEEDIDELAGLDEATLLSMTSDAPYSLSPSPCASPSPKGSSKATMLSNFSPPPSADPFLEGFTSRLQAVAAAEINNCRSPELSPAAGYESDDASDKEIRFSDRLPAGRRPESTRLALQECFQQLDSIVMAASDKTGLPPATIRSEFMEGHGTVYTRSDWCKYQAYYAQNIDAERRRVGDLQASPSQCYKSFKLLPRWKELLSACEDLHATRTQSLRERRRDFDRTCARFGKLVNDAHTRHFEAFVALVGSCVNEDISLGYLQASTGLEGLLATRLDMTDNEFLGYAKSEAFHQSALASTREWSAGRTASGASVKAEVASAVSVGGSNLAEGNTGPGGTLKVQSAEALRTLCKVALFGLYGEAGHPLVKESKGKGKAKATDSTEPSNHRLPWNTLPHFTAAEGLRLVAWPWGVDFPGQSGGKVQGGKAQGIKALPTEAARLLLAALNGETGLAPRLLPADNPNVRSTNEMLDVREGLIPVMLTVAPPPGSAEDYGHVIFADGTVQKCSEKFGVPREDILLPSARRMNDPKPTPPAPPPTPPVRMTRSKKSSLSTAPSNENPVAPRVDGPSHKSQGHKASTVSEKSKPAPSRIHVVVESSDSEATTSDLDGAESTSAPKAASNAPLDLHSRGLKKPLPMAVKPSEPVVVKPRARRSNSTAPPAAKPSAQRSASSEPPTNKAPANRPPVLPSTSTEPVTIKPPSRCSTSSEPVAIKPPSRRSTSSQPGSSLKVNVDEFIPLTADALTKYAGLSSTHGATSSSDALTGSKRLGGVTGARPPSPPKKARLAPIPETADLPSAAIASVTPAPASVATEHALPAPPSAPIASAAPATAVVPSAVTVAHAPPAPPSAPVPSTAALPREQAFYVPPGMMLDPAYFGGGGFMRFGGDPSSMFQSSHFSPMHGAFIPPQSMGGFPSFGGAVQPQGAPAFFFPGNYGARAHMQASAPTDLPASVKR